MKLAIKRRNIDTPTHLELAACEGLLFLIGMNIHEGLRVNDLIRLKVANVEGKPIFEIREGKTNKRREINIGMLQEEIQRFITDKQQITTYLNKRLVELLVGK